MSAADPNTGQSKDQLVELARRFPTEFVERKDGDDYVAHHVVNQRLLSIVGPFDFKLVQVLRGDVSALEPDPAGRSRRAKSGSPALSGVVVGGIWRLVAEVDGRRVEVEEVGAVDPRNKDHDGERLKTAASDALKRCAMRLGLGLHLWAQEHYFLDQQLAAQFTTPPQDQPAAAPQESEPDGAGERDGGLDAEHPVMGVPSQGEASGNATTPPPSGSDAPRFGGPGAARSWLRGQDGLRPLVEEALGGAEHLGEASLDDLQAAIDLAWRKTQQAA